MPGINDYPTYSRNDNEYNLSVEIDFDNLVPEIENSDFILANPPSETSFKKEIIKILLEKAKFGANSAKDFTLEKVNDVKNVTMNFFDKIKSLFSGSDSGADISGQIIKNENDSWQIPLIQESDSISDLNIMEQELLEIQEELEEEVEKILKQQDLGELEQEKLASLEKMRQELDYISRTLLEMKRIIEEYLAKQKPEEALVCSISDAEHIPERNKIIFNEIAWMGTKNSSNDEWIELKNISGDTIDMNNWQIQDKAGLEDNTKGINIIFENTTINPDKFFLLERTDDTSVPNVTADLIYTGALNNTDEALYLFDDNCKLQDKVEAITTWGYGSNSSKATMERKTDLSWQTSENDEGTPNTNNSPGSYEDSETTDTTDDDNNNNESDQNTSSSSGGSSGSTPSPVFYPVLINEIMYNLDGSDDGREWIEIFNNANVSVDLSNWKLYEDGINHGLTLIQGTNILFPNQYAVIINDKNEFLKDYPAHSGTIFDSSFSLNNNGEELTIKNQDLFIDNIDYSATWGADGDGNSIQKITPGLDSNDLNNWKPALPTPGAINVFPPASPATATTTSTTATSTTATSTNSYSALDVVINEIAWMGTEADSTDEWIELYNNTSQEIDLNNWAIAWGEGTSTNSIDLTSNISAYGFYLLERTASTTISDIEENQIYTGALNNDGENIKLIDSSSNLIDEFDCSSGWFAGDNDTKQTMERISPSTSGNNSNNWANNNTQTINGLDADNNPILGTPNAKNSLFSTLPPNPVPNFSIDQENSKYDTAVLAWSTTTDPDTPEQNLSYVIYWEKQEITEQNASTTNPTAFSTTTATTTINLFNLDYDSTYYFGIRAFDGENYSSLSTSTSYNTPLPAITDLNAGTSAIRKAIDLFWTSNGAENYIIKRAEKEIVENTTSTDKINWEQADFVSTSSATTIGEIENFVVNDLDPEKIYYFAIRSINTTNSISEISNSKKGKAILGFQDNGNETITDLYTKLMWIKDGDGLGCNNGTTTSWNETVSFIDDLNSTTTGGFAGYSDWRLPNFKELASIIDYSKNSPIIDENYFTNTKSAKHWTSNKISLDVQAYTGGNPYRIYSIDFNNGYIDYYDWGGGYVSSEPETPYYYIRLLRDLSTTSTNILSSTGLQGDPSTICSSGCSDNNNGTITDDCTNLMWIKGETETLIGDSNTISWKNAFNLCNNLNTAGYNDWRIPNIMEIINASNKNGSAILSWKSGNSGYYLSSTLVGDRLWKTGNGYYIGKVQLLPKSSSHYIQCVRE
ncbi:MAG: Lcl domain-containing protein [Candidatus Heimdallarchaeaceae archaeon]